MEAQQPQQQQYQRLKLSLDAETGIAHMLINRPEKKNMLDSPFFSELPEAVKLLDASHDVRIIILAGEGAHFCAGLELSVLGSHIGERAQASASSSDDLVEDQGRIRENLRRCLVDLQAAISSLELCRKPVIAAIHGACLSVGVDLASVCDIRYCTEDAFFAMTEIDQAIVGDHGVIQRIPRLVGLAPLAEMMLTGRRYYGPEMFQKGLVQAVLRSKAALDEYAERTAREIASKSPLAVAGLKTIIIKCRDLTVAQGLDLVAAWNAAFLLSSDLKEALTAQLQKRKPRFPKL